MGNNSKVVWIIMSEDKIVSLRDISKKFDDACKLEESQMNSFKPSKITPGRELLTNQYKMEEALRKARAKAEKDIFKQKVAANLIVGGALIVIFLMFYWWRMRVILGLIIVIISFTFVSAMLVRQDNSIREQLNNARQQNFQMQLETKEKK